jgi:hypothetical protein
VAKTTATTGKETQWDSMMNEEEEGLIDFMALVNKAIEQEDRGMFEWLAGQLFHLDIDIERGV